jgi:hypothetical protein
MLRFPNGFCFGHRIGDETGAREPVHFLTVEDESRRRH